MRCKHDMSRKDSYCPVLGTPYIFSDRIVPNTRLIHKLRCKQWTCEYCSRINALQHKIRIADGIRELQDKGYKFGFVTLTSHEKLKGFEATYTVWKKAWEKLSQRYRRVCNAKFGVDAHFVYVIETHKDGRLHVHGFVFNDISKRWWKDNARGCGLGYQVELLPVENAGHAVSYVTKYLTKQCGQDYPIKGVRRIGYSRKFPSQDTDKPSDDWLVADKDTSIVALIEHAWRVLDFDVELHGQKITEIIDS